MPRRPRQAQGGLVYHVLNRSVRRMPLFEKPEDFQAFEQVLEQAWARVALRVLTYSIMPNHWHLVLWPRKDDELSEFMRWLTVTHTQRWHVSRGTTGTGPIYQGRFKSFPIQPDAHLLTVCRYVERNALRAGLVKRAEEWRWCNLGRRRAAPQEVPEFLTPSDAWPVAPPRSWLAVVNGADEAEDLARLRHSVARGTPFGELNWQKRTAAKLGLESSLRPRGRPKA